MIQRLALITSMSIGCMALVAGTGCTAKPQQILASLARNSQLSGSEETRNNQNLLLDNRFEKALVAHDLDTAEEISREGIRLNPETKAPYRRLGDVLFAKGNKKGAFEAYWTAQHDPRSISGGEEFDLRYANLAADYGKVDEAKAVFRQLIKNRPMNLPDSLVMVNLDRMQLDELRATCTVMVAQFYSGDILSGKYLLMTKSATQSSPQSFYAHLKLADALYINGKLADSRVEFDRAISLAPKSVKSQIEPWIDSAYRFHSWDHKSVGIIKDGKVTITQTKIPLPNDLIDRGKLSNSTSKAGSTQTSSRISP